MDGPLVNYSAKNLSNTRVLIYLIKYPGKSDTALGERLAKDIMQTAAYLLKNTESNASFSQKNKNSHFRNCN